MIEIDRRSKLYSIWPVGHLSPQLLPGRLRQSNYEQASPSPRISFKEGVGVSTEWRLDDKGDRKGRVVTGTPGLSSAACFKDLTPSRLLTTTAGRSNRLTPRLPTFNPSPSPHALFVGGRC
jgi:hypothetical protein